MEFERTRHEKCYAVRISAVEEGREVGRAFVYVLFNDLHEEPFGLLEDVYVDEGYRSRGVGTQLVETAIAEAKGQGCYKLIATSRHGRETLHAWYEKLGFTKHGVEFRLDLVS